MVSPKAQVTILELACHTDSSLHILPEDLSQHLFRGSQNCSIGSNIERNEDRSP
jgi:hypothetical protein